MRLTFELAPDRDGRWSARVSDMPESQATGSTAEEAAARAKAKALEVLARRLSSGAVESIDVDEVTFVSKDLVPPSLPAYIEAAIQEAVIERLEDGSFSGQTPPCAGVVAFGRDRLECVRELRSVLEDWVVTGLKLGHALPVIGGIRLHDQAKATKPVGAL